MNRADNVLVLAVIDGLVNEAMAAQMAIAAVFIGGDQLRGVETAVATKSAIVVKPISSTAFAMTLPFD